MEEIQELPQEEFFEYPTILPVKEEKYDRNMNKVMSLLQACIMTPSSDGGMNIKYLIEDTSHRLELQNYAMNLIRKSLKPTIKVAPLE